MGVIERRKREKENRINDILDAAEKVFFSKSKDKASIDDVASAAELIKGAIYHYFKSKEELYFGLNYRALIILEKMFKKATENKTTGFDKANAIGEAYFNFYKQYPDYFGVMSYFEVNKIDLDANDPLKKRYHIKAKQTIKILVSALMKGKFDRSISSDIKPLKSAIVLWGQMTGVLNVIALKGERLEKDFNINKEDIINHFSKLMSKIMAP